MGTTSCIIEFENSKECYRPGEVITGRVTLDINCTNYILLKALSLQFSGYAYTKWAKPEKIKILGKANTLTESREDYVSSTNYLVGSEMATPKPFQPGQHSYSFMINIPQNIPSTFDSPLGFIRYEIIVNADYGDHARTLCNTPVIIEELKDLRLVNSSQQLAAETHQLELTKYIKFWQQPLQLYISIPQTAFVAGEYISLNIKLINHAKLKVQTITSNLNRIATYKGLQREKKADTTTETITIASNLQNLYGRNLKQTQLLLEIFIPKTPPSMTFDECKCINLSYEVEVLVTTQNKKRWVRAIVPILIGSISLRSDAKMMPLISQNVPAIRVANSMEELTLPSVIDLQNNLSAIEAENISSSLQEADFMTAVQLNKKSRNQIVGDLKNFKPKYLYYDLSDAT